MTTIQGQNHFDVAIQELGTLDEVDEVLSRISNPNDEIPYATEILLPDTEDIVAKNRIFNDINIATGVDAAEEIAAGIGEMFIESPIPVFTIS